MLMELRIAARTSPASVTPSSSPSSFSLDDGGGFGEEARDGMDEAGGMIVLVVKGGGGMGWTRRGGSD